MTLRMIGYYDDSATPGGTTRYLCDLLAALDRNRYRPVLFAPEGREWHQILADFDCPVVTLRSRLVRPQTGDTDTGSGNPSARHRLPAQAAWTAGLLRETAGLVRLFRRRLPDLLHLNNTGAEPAPLAAALAGVPRVIGTLHTSPDYDLHGERQGLRYRLLECASMRSLDRTIAVSRRTGEQWSARCRLGAGYRKRITVIHNGVDVRHLDIHPSKASARQRLGLPQNATLIGCAGRLDEAKGQRYLMGALAQIQRQFPSIGVALAGLGPQEPFLRKLAGELGVQDSTFFVGQVADIRDFLAGLDVYAQPSLCEAHPYAVLEAAGTSLPIIASDVGGIGETLHDGHEGILVPPKAPDALAGAMERLLLDPAAATEMGRRAQARIVRDFRREEATAGAFAVYEEAFTRHGGSPIRGVTPERVA